MTQTATSKRGQGVVISVHTLHATGKGKVFLHIDGDLIDENETVTASAARAKAAELTDDVGLIWETRP